MAISYHVYANDGHGGLVNYATPIATTLATTFTPPNLAPSSDTTFAVRAFDTASNIEEANTDARVRVVIDGSGRDVTTRPNAVKGLSATPTAGGTCWVSWGYDATGQGGPPAQFNVTLTAVGSAPSATPAATVACLPGVMGYGCSLSGLAGNTSYSVAVQAVGASAYLVGPSVAVPVTYLSSTLSAVDSLTATPSA